MSLIGEEGALITYRRRSSPECNSKCPPSVEERVIRYTGLVPGKCGWDNEQCCQSEPTVGHVFLRARHVGNCVYEQDQCPMPNRKANLSTHVEGDIVVPQFCE